MLRPVANISARPSDIQELRTDAIHHMALDGRSYRLQGRFPLFLAKRPGNLYPEIQNILDILDLEG